MMMIQDIKVNNLEPISPPEPVAFWPPQPGWYVVIAILLLLLIYGIYKYVQYKKRNAYRKRALAELENLNKHNPDQTLLADLNALLKVTALKGYPRHLVAELTGMPWLEFLERTEPRSKFSKAPGTLLVEASFTRPDRLNVDQNEWNELIRMSHDWIKSHKHLKKSD